MFYSSKGPGINHQDVNYDVVLHNCNGKLSLWSDAWTREMHRGKSMPHLTVNSRT